MGMIGCVCAFLRVCVSVRWCGRASVCLIIYCVCVPVHVGVYNIVCDVRIYVCLRMYVRA